MLRCTPTAVVLVALATSPLTAKGQDAGNGFLFGAPMGSFTIRGGWALPRAHSDLFAFTTEQLTLSRGDFSSPDIEGDLAFRVTARESFDEALASSSRGTTI